jgi:ankyrin repeat protein
MVEDQKKRRSAIFNCLKDRDYHGVRRCLEEGISPEETENGENSALLLAADDGLLNICELLIEYGANVNYKSDIGESCLGCAVSSDHFPIVELLLRKGANPNIKDIFGASMSEISENSSEEIKKILKDYGCIF